MSSYLFITFFGCCTLLKVQTSEDGVLAETLFDFQLSFLHSTLFVKFGLLLLMLLFLSLVVGKEVKLLGSIPLCRHRCLRYHMVRCQIQPANQQIWIHMVVKQL